MMRSFAALQRGDYPARDDEQRAGSDCRLYYLDHNATLVIDSGMAISHVGGMSFGPTIARQVAMANPLGWAVTVARGVVALQKMQKMQKIRSGREWPAEIAVIAVIRETLEKRASDGHSRQPSQIAEIAGIRRGPSTSLRTVARLGSIVIPSKD